jgi:hypothetical protein
VEENLEEKEFAKGLLGMSPRSGVGNKRGFKEKANEAQVSRCSSCAGVGKSSAVTGLRR